MTTISIGHPITFALKAGKVQAIDLRNYDFEFPTNCRLGFSATADMWFKSDDYHVESHRGFFVKQGEGLMTFDTAWYKDHILYIISEVEATLTFEVVFNNWSHHE